MGGSGHIRCKRFALAVALALALGPAPARALDRLDFDTPGAPDDLRRALRAASPLLLARAEGNTDPTDLFAAAQAEYGRLLGALYAAGHYSGVIHVRIDGREAAAIAPLDAPARIGRIEVVVQPGPRFRFGQAGIGPLAPRTALPAGFAPGQVAASGAIGDAVQAAIDGWRLHGHAKAAVADQDLRADHARATLAARIALDPGPRLRFGRLTFQGQDRMREDRLHAIAGFPEGEVFDPREIRQSADRLRRTGVFTSVALTEAQAPNPDGTLDIAATVAEELPRRFGFGAELASLDGLSLTGFWMHRNLLGGAERLRFEGTVDQIGATGNGLDASLAVTLDRPATFTPDTVLTLGAEAARSDEPDQRIDAARLGLGLRHRFSDSLTGALALEYEAQEVRDLTGTTRYQSVALPLGLIWDRRDNVFDATRGFLLDAEAKPFAGLDGTDSGLRLTLDARGFRRPGGSDRLVLAARVQAGAVLGASLLGTPRDYLFYSGGGGTVRGQPYQSLGVLVAQTGQELGGSRFLGASGELRAQVTDRIGVVGFLDWGHVAVTDFFDATGASHAGAGLGLRYATGIGPIRLDLAAPIDGATGDGVQVYIGLGQAF